MSTPIVRRRKRPTVVDTIQWTGTNEADVRAFAGAIHFHTVGPEDRYRVEDPDITAEVWDELHSTWVGVKTGQHIVRGVKGEYYPIAEDVLTETYERVSGAAKSGRSARRQIIAALSEDSLGGIATLADVAHAEQLVDAYRAEVLAKAADYFEQRRPSREDAVSDFDRGRRATVGWVVEELREKATAEAATATPDFFQKGRTYTSTGPFGLRLRFECEHLTRDPKVGDREAWGWLHRSDGTRRMQRMWDHDYPRWTVESGDDRG
ncbi:hypothetical protein [Streptomyces sp. MB09-02B]|uniref:hypothetical protein n=1 Tax=Streptomyces sp. MB09-02B TaxID=3028667 RepID=UPI0029B02655|nr:hypothetical protein [Streptomyces sp. MB09-02B]MDX3639301.1 hypothetical protein [Streptomyces sp. MB09-02B]